MALFKLQASGSDISQAELIQASHRSLELEQHLECWLEKSPWAIAEESLLVIGRQTSASVESGTIFPDLLALDKDGNLVVVELKKGKAPRDVVAQLLEYAAWAGELSEQRIEDIAQAYLSRQSGTPPASLVEVFSQTFEADSLPALNQSQRLFVAAEEISPTVSRVCRFLRTSHGVDVNCVEFSVFQTEAGEILVNSEWIVGHEDLGSSKHSTADRWTGEKTVNQVVWEAVQELTGGDVNYVFSPRDVTEVVLRQYSNFKKSNVSCEIIGDCVNHTSRHHYPGGHDRYWWLEKGKYRLFNPDTDNVAEPQNPSG